MRTVARKCPHCGERIEYLEVSKQIEGSLLLSEPQSNIEWRSPEEQTEPEIYTCPVCLVEIEEETLKEWDLRNTVPTTEQMVLSDQKEMELQGCR